MKSFAFIVLLNLVFSSSEECNSDHDDTLLLQTRAVTEVRKRKVPRVHRYHINIQEDGVSLLQSHHVVQKQADVVFTATAIGDEGNSEASQDGHGAHREC